MRSRWEGLRAGLIRSTRTLQADKQFRDFKAQHPSITGFADPGALIAHLNSKQGELDEKDRILGALITFAQENQHSELATALLWLGLWPGLDAAYRRRAKHFVSEPEELCSAMSEAFSSLIGRMDLNSVRRVAATLVRSTERDVMEARRRLWAETNRRANDSELDRQLADSALAQRATAEAVETQLGWRPDSGFVEDEAALRAWLEPIVGDDTELLIAVLVLEETQREAGERLGLSHDVTRKRFQRALGQLRQHLGTSLSQPLSPTRV